MKSMADPKYANLYGIASDQPDVYETSDLPEVDQQVDMYEEESKAVERLAINASDAFSKFKGKDLDASAVDFSDNVRRRYNSGYVASSGHWELAAFGEKETPLQKYNRLKLEFEEFLQELSSLAKRNEIEQSDVSDLAFNLTKETDALYKKLSQLKLEDTLGSGVVRDITESDGLNLFKLRTKLEKLSSGLVPANESDMKENEQDVDNSVINYQLNIKPSLAQLAYTSRITELERKLNKLEALMGTPNNDFMRLCNLNANENGIMGFSQWMVAKLSLLDNAQLDAIESRAAMINTRLEQLADKHGLPSNQDLEKDKKINELYELSNKARSFSDIMPDLFNQMTALRSLHQQAKHAVEVVTNLELIQAEISASVTNNELALKNVDSSLKDNVSVIKNNVDSLQKRIDTLLEMYTKYK